MKRWLHGCTAFAVPLAAVGGAVVAWRRRRRCDNAAAEPAGRGAVGAGDRQAAVIQKSMPVQVEAIGTVQTMANVVVRARVDTQMEKVMFKEGDAVKAGDVLFQLDKRSIEAHDPLARPKRSWPRASRAVCQLGSVTSIVITTLLQRDYASQQKADAVKGTDSMALDATIAWRSKRRSMNLRGAVELLHYLRADHRPHRRRSS